MPNTKSAKKRLKQSQERRIRNRAAKSVLRKRIRNVKDAIGATESEGVEREYRLTAKSLDRAAARGVIHPNKAARIKSRLQRLIKSSAASA